MVVAATVGLVIILLLGSRYVSEATLERSPIKHVISMADTPSLGRSNVDSAITAADRSGTRAMVTSRFFLQKSDNWEAIKAKLEALDLFLSGLDEAFLEEAIAVYQEGGFDESSNLYELEVILKHCARLDVTAALEYAFEEIGGDIGTSAILPLLSKNASIRPQDMIRYQHAVSSLEYEGFGKVLIQKMVESDQQMSIPEFLDSISVMNLRLASIPWAVVAAIDGGVDPASVADWAMSYSRVGPGSSLPSVVARSWAERDPVGAIKWALSLEGFSGQAQVVGIVSKTWASSNPEAAGRYLNSIETTGTEIDQALLQYSIIGSETDPRAAISWAEDIQDPIVKANAVYRVMENWGEKEAEVAKTYISQAPWPISLREQGELAIESPEESR